MKGRATNTSCKVLYSPPPCLQTRSLPSRAQKHLCAIGGALAKLPTAGKKQGRPLCGSASCIRSSAKRQFAAVNCDPERAGSLGASLSIASLPE
jgi:hypothetical protein